MCRSVLCLLLVVISQIPWHRRLCRLCKCSGASIRSWHRESISHPWTGCCLIPNTWRHWGNTMLNTIQSSLKMLPSSDRYWRSWFAVMPEFILFIHNCDSGSARRERSARSCAISRQGFAEWRSTSCDGSRQANPWRFLATEWFLFVWSLLPHLQDRENAS